MDKVKLYKIIGKKIASVRKGKKPKYSQKKLADGLGLTRASVVNIEAGRQHPPVHVLWGIAELLETDLTLLIPSNGEYNESVNVMKLSPKMVEQIEDKANQDPKVRKVIEDFIMGKRNMPISTEDDNN